ncbi:MAG TPA: long-chain fatty acid--CoA ligase [Candidatus Dormibacteraeota bacterium]|nr:long-chain fatty acid--CoA ligase [Candidatus Dormibacteraeota bacterium]
MTVTSAATTRRPWLKFYDNGVPRSLTYPEFPLHTFLDRSAAEHPDVTATIFFNARLTYRELSELADRFAAGLQSLGVKKGDRVALVLPNSPQFVIAFYGAMRAGAIAVPTNPLYTPREMAHQFNATGAEVVIVLSRIYPVVKAIATQTPTVKHVVVTNIKEYMPAFLRTLFTVAREKKDGHRADLTGDQRVHAFADLVRSAAKPAPVAVEPRDLAALLATGGTTGVPKFAMLSHRALVANALQCRAWFPGSEPGLVTLAVMPFFHSYGLTVLMNQAVAGAYTLVLIPQFKLEDVLGAIQKHRPQHFPGAPRIYVALNNSPVTKRYDLRSIRACISGSAPLPLEVATTFEKMTHGGKIVEGYGLTEAGPVTHANPINGYCKIGTVGIPFPDVDAKIVDLETGTREVAPGERGELLVRGPNLMDGYWQRPDETDLTLRDGWLVTGDIATVDEDGYFTIVERKKEMIIVSGFNVYPREVEEVLYTHPAVMEAAAIGMPDAQRGEVVKCFVVLKPGQTATADELIAYSRGQLTGYKVPHAIEFRTELPKSLIGKILRRQLADEDRAKRQQAAT